TLDVDETLRLERHLGGGSPLAGRDAHEHRIAIERDGADRGPKLSPLIGLGLETGRNEVFVERALVDRDVAHRLHALLDQSLRERFEVAPAERGVTVATQDELVHAPARELPVDPRREHVAGPEPAKSDAGGD